MKQKSRRRRKKKKKKENKKEVDFVDSNHYTCFVVVISSKCTDSSDVKLMIDRINNFPTKKRVEFLHKAGSGEVLCF